MPIVNCISLSLISSCQFTPINACVNGQYLQINNRYIDIFVFVNLLRRLSK